MATFYLLFKRSEGESLPLTVICAASGEIEQVHCGSRLFSTTAAIQKALEAVGIGESRYEPALHTLISGFPSFVHITDSEAYRLKIVSRW